MLSNLDDRDRALIRRRMRLTAALAAGAAVLGVVAGLLL